MKNKKNKITIIILSILAILFIALTILVCLGLTKNIDKSVYDFIISFRNNILDTYFKGITRLGDPTMIIILLCLCVVLIRGKNIFYLSLSTALSALFNQIIKHIVQRPRPDELRLIYQGGYSYPSGHSMISICFYGFLFYYVYKYVKNKYIKTILLLLLSIIIISIPISRIYVGVHYFSDVIGGLLLGGFILIIVIKYGNKLIRGN